MIKTDGNCPRGFSPRRNGERTATMKEIYYTVCEAGKSVPGSGGFQARAASAGIDPLRLQAAMAYAGYALPAGVTPETAVTAAPVRLALLATSDVGRLLCHCAW